MLVKILRLIYPGVLMSLLLLQISALHGLLPSKGRMANFGDTSIQGV
jgi:hypothetical protein